MLRPTIANEADRDRRQRLEHGPQRARRRSTCCRSTWRRSAIEQAAVRELGAPNYAELYDGFGFQLDELAEQCRALPRRDRSRCTSSRPTGSSASGSASASPRRSAGTCARLFRAPEWDTAFPARPDAPRARGDARRPRHRSATPRRTSSSTSRSVRRRRRAPSARRSRCRQRVVLVIQPIGGVDDWRALFHEAGHTEHFAHTNADLAVEDRRLGDIAVTEGWAMLMEHLVQDAAWLNRRLDVPAPGRVRRRGCGRRCCTSSAATARSCSTRSSCIEAERPRPAEDAIRRAPRPTP